MTLRFPKFKYLEYLKYVISDSEASQWSCSRAFDPKQKTFAVDLWFSFLKKWFQEVMVGEI